MSLQVWLPLNGDLHNQGIKNVDIVNNEAIINDSGKIGKCYSFNGSNSYIKLSQYNFYNQKYTVSAWVYTTSSTQTQTICCNRTSVGNGFSIFLQDEKLRIDPGGKGLRWGTNYIFPINTWFHLTVVYDGSAVSYYINGEFKQKRVLSIDSSYWDNTTSIGAFQASGSNYGNYLIGKLNDLRIYNNTLSQQQIKEISKGLILHYPLNRNGWGLPSNLLKNGFGELGTENWDKGVYTDDLPAVDISIQARFQESTSLEYIPIYRNHIYRYSTYTKSSETSGSYYPSLLPYDRDYNFIAYRNCAEGFNLDTMTILTQELKSGDNKIYVEDLSQWNANSGHYYNYAAIFSYADSTGYIYPDGVYTQNTPQFASGTTAKTNLDKTNNIITLIANYTGPTIPVGTHICASSAGAQYFYPCGAINCKSVSNWTYKTATFSSNHDRLLNAKYVKISSYGKGTQAGILLEDITSDATLNGTIQYDISGYQNNGTKNNITYNSDTPKYNVSSVFNSTDTSYIKVNENNWIPQYQEAMTINLWVYSSDWASAIKLFSCAQSGGWTTEPGNSGYIRFSIYVATNQARTSHGYKFNSKELKISDLSAGWHMLTFIYDSTGNKVYVDGQSHSSYAFTSYGIKYNTNARLFLGCEANSASPAAPYFDGKVSDFRIYATVLSEKDILSLYNNEAYIDQLNAIHGEIR